MPWRTLSRTRHAASSVRQRRACHKGEPEQAHRFQLDDGGEAGIGAESSVALVSLKLGSSGL